MNKDYWKDKKVFITGNTGFKGTWLCLMLLGAGAKVYGYSKDYPTTPSLFKLTGLYLDIPTIWGDIRDYKELKDAIADCRATHIIHLAAQPIVKDGYKAPKYTFEVNVNGTLNVLLAGELIPTVTNVLIITTDKVYGDAGVLSFREHDPMEASDPYSTSKAMADLAVSCYQKSFYKGKKLSQARAGNVVGFGDFAYRVLPMTIESLMAGKDPFIWDPTAIRPWQSVMDCLNGYLMLMESEKSGAWNFGPLDQEQETVGTIVDKICELWAGVKRKKIDCPDRYTLGVSLRLDSSKANAELKWEPKWSLDTTLENLVKSYKRYIQKDDPRTICEETLKQWLNS